MLLLFESHLEVANGLLVLFFIEVITSSDRAEQACELVDIFIIHDHCVIASPSTSLLGLVRLFVSMFGGDFRRKGCAKGLPAERLDRCQYLVLLTFRQACLDQDLLDMVVRRVRDERCNGLGSVRCSLCSAQAR